MVPVGPSHVTAPSGGYISRWPPWGAFLRPRPLGVVGDSRWGFIVPGWFVTGTDTGVGKTVIAGALARLVQERGKRVAVFKPVATGCRRDLRLGLVCDD